MLVDEEVELVLPPFPPPPKLSASTTVPGTRSKGSVLAPAVDATASTRTRPKKTRRRLPTFLDTFPPFRGTGRRGSYQLRRGKTRFSRATFYKSQGLTREADPTSSSLNSRRRRRADGSYAWEWARASSRRLK